MIASRAEDLLGARESLNFSGCGPYCFFGV
jgi:hypothetical protein